MQITSRFNFVATSLDLKEAILSADQLNNLMLVGTLSGLYQVDLVKQRYVQIFKQLRNVSKVHVVSERYALVSAGASDLKYPILPEASEYKYQ